MKLTFHTVPSSAFLHKSRRAAITDVSASKEELKYLYEFAVYEKINIIVIESIQSEALIGEKGWILDKDLCIIELNELTAPVKR